MIGTAAAYARGLWQRADEHDFLFLAAALSFSIIVCIVPFLLIVFAIGGLLFEQAAFTAQVNAFIETVVPYPDTARFVKEVVAGGAQEFRIYKNLAGAAGLVGLLFGSSALFSTIRTIFRRIGPGGKGRSAIVGKLHDLMMIFLVMTLFLLGAAVLPAMQIVEHLLSTAGFGGGTILAQVKPFILDAATAATLFLVLFLIHLLVPAARPTRGAAAAAAASTTALWLVAAWLFGIYIEHIAVFSRIYGAYVLGIVVLFWIHYSSAVFILGAEVGQIYRERSADAARARAQRRG